MTSLVHRALLIALGGFAAGCGPDVCPGAPAVELVEWDDPSIVLEDGDPITIWTGPQGGWHVFFGLRISSASPKVTVDLTADALSKQVVRSTWNLRARGHAGCEGELLGLQGFLDIWELQTETAWSAPQILGGQDIAVTVEVETEEGPAVDAVRLVGLGDEGAP